MAEPRYRAKRVEVEILTDPYQIRGIVFVPLAGKGSYGSRLSDLLNNSDAQFLSVTDVKAVVLPDPNEKWEAPFMAINKNAVKVAPNFPGLALLRPIALYRANAHPATNQEKAHRPPS